MSMYFNGTKIADDISLVDNATPIGGIIPFGGIVAPNGWLLCDGSAISRTEYAELFAAIGTNFGSGNGVNTFNLPDMTGRIAVGKSDEEEFSSLGKRGGSKYLQSHSHEVRGEDQTSSVTIGNSVWGWDSGVIPANGSNAGSHVKAIATGQGDSENLQPYTVTNYIIKARELVAVKESMSVEEVARIVLETQNPVGTILIKTTNVNPSTYLGFGTWELWGSGRVPVGVNSTDSDFNTAEKIGGEKTHTLTIDEMPKHNHMQSLVGRTAGNSNNMAAYSWSVPTNQYNYDGYDLAQIRGGSLAHNNLQPYITCYMWKRTA